MNHLWFIGYRIVHCFSIVPLNLDFSISGNIYPMIFLFVDASIYYTLIIKSFPNIICCVVWFTLTVVCVVHCSSRWQCWKHAFWLTGSNLLPYMVSASVFFLLLFLLIQNTKYKYGATYPTCTVSTYESSNTLIFNIEVHFISNV